VRNPWLEDRDNEDFHPCLQPIARSLSELLAGVSLSVREPLERVGGIDVLHRAVERVTLDASRKYQLSDLVTRVVYQRATVAVDYMTAFPALMASSSRFGVQALARIAAESIALLDWHCEPVLSTEERLLRALRDAHSTWVKMSGRSEQDLSRSERSVSQRTQAEAEHTRLKQRVDESSAEIARAEQVVAQTHSMANAKACRKIPNATRAVDSQIERIAREHLGQNDLGPLPMYEMLSASVHSESLIMDKMWHRADVGAADARGRRSIGVEQLLMPLGCALMMMSDTFWRMGHYWKRSYPIESANECMELIDACTRDHWNEPAHVERTSAF